MDETKVRRLLQQMIEGYGQTIRRVEAYKRERPDQPPIDVEWFRVMSAKSRACLAALDSGDMEEFRALIEHIKVQKDQPPFPSAARALGLLPPLDWPTAEDLGIPANSGSQQTLVRCDEIKPGHLYLYAENPPADPTRLPLMLNDAFGRWMKENPNAKVRATLPIVAGANTVAFHVWFDRGRDEDDGGRK